MAYCLVIVKTQERIDSLTKFTEVPFLMILLFATIATTQVVSTQIIYLLAHKKTMHKTR